MGRKSYLPSAAFIIILTIIIAGAGCEPGDIPVGPGGDLSAADFRDEPEGCIDAVLECYENFTGPDAVAKYAGVLHPDYRWYFQPKDVAPGRRPYLDREEDVSATGRIFANATILQLDISPGIWYELCELEEMPCEGCWTTTRKYMIIAQFGESGRIHRGNDIVVIIAVPDPDFPERFVLRAMYDVDDD